MEKIKDYNYCTFTDFLNKGDSKYFESLLNDIKNKIEEGNLIRITDNPLHSIGNDPIEINTIQEFEKFIANLK